MLVCEQLKMARALALISEWLRRPKKSDNNLDLDLEAFPQMARLVATCEEALKASKPHAP